MKKWMTALVAVGAAVVAGFVIRQVMEDFSDNAELWRSVTDAPAEG